MRLIIHHPWKSCLSPRFSMQQSPRSQHTPGRRCWSAQPRRKRGMGCPVCTLEQPIISQRRHLRLLSFLFLLLDVTGWCNASYCLGRRPVGKDLSETMVIPRADGNLIGDEIIVSHSSMPFSGCHLTNGVDPVCILLLSR